MAFNLAKKKKQRKVLTEEEKQRIRKIKKREKLSETLYGAVGVFILLLWVSLDTFAYDLFIHYGWNTTILDLTYITLDIIVTIIFFLLGLLMVWLTYYVIKLFVKEKQYEKTPIKSISSMIFLFILFVGLGFFFMVSSIANAIQYLNYFF